jgi:predicted metal-dependent HD superfamily phosphohydrolase
MHEKDTIMNRWFNLFPADDYDREKVKSVYNSIVNAYCAPHRHYHTMNHIEFMLDKIDEMFNIYQFTNYPSKKFAIYCAAFFHDIYYNPQANNELSDEELSATIAIDYLKDIGIESAETLEHIYELIILTKTHTIDKSLYTNETMQAIMIDADMAIMGVHREDYLQYAKDVATEYSFVDDKIFREGRAKFLHDILSKDAIFNTEYMCQVYEANARLNIRTEVSVLDKLSIDDMLDNVINPEG